VAISEHDQQVLRELEKDLLIDDPSSSLSPARRRGGGFLVATAELVAGLLVVFAGLGLADPVGTWVGVAGSLILVAGAWVVVNNATLKSRISSRRDDPSP
jgi:hypothetical protein